MFMVIRLLMIGSMANVIGSDCRAAHKGSRPITEQSGKQSHIRQRIATFTEIKSPEPAVETFMSRC